jgi:hypothetical protein
MRRVNPGRPRDPYIWHYVWRRLSRIHSNKGLNVPACTGRVMRNGFELIEIEGHPAEGEVCQNCANLDMPPKDEW